MKKTQNAAREPESRRCPINYQHREVIGKKYFCFFDEQGVWLHVSEGLCELLGYPYEEIVGNTVEKFKPPDRTRELELLEKFRTVGYIETMYVVRNRQGDLIHFRFTATKLNDGCTVAFWYPYKK